LTLAGARAQQRRPQRASGVYLDRLRREVDEHSALAQFPGFEVKFEDAEADERPSGGAHFHPVLLGGL